MRSPSAPAAVQPIDASKSMGEYLFGSDFTTSYKGVTDPLLQQRIIEAERANRPAYAALELQDINTYLKGADGQQGVIELTADATRKAAELDREASTAQRRQDIAILGEYGAQTTDAMRKSDPYATAIAEQQQKLAMDTYGRTGNLSFEDQRTADQNALIFGQRAGRLGDNSSIAAQILNREQAKFARRQEAQQTGQNAYAMNRGLAGDTGNIVLGRPSTAAGMGSQFFGQAAGLAQGPTGPQLFDPNAGVNLALQNNANKSQYDASIYGAKAGLQGAVIGGALSAVGSIGGGFAGRG